MTLGVTLVLATNQSIRLSAGFGPTPPTVTDGVGGWAEVQRPRRLAITEWAGPAPLKASVQLLFDGFVANRTVEPQLNTLTGVFAPVSSVRVVEPPRMRVYGARPVPGTIDWVATGLTWDELIRNSRGTIIRAVITLSLLQYVAGDTLIARGATVAARAASKAASSASAGKPPTKARTYQVRSGDTLSKIAASQLGNYRRWPEIAKLNSLRDPNKLRIGQVLRLP